MTGQVRVPTEFAPVGSIWVWVGEAQEHNLLPPYSSKKMHRVSSYVAYSRLSKAVCRGFKNQPGLCVAVLASLPPGNQVADTALVHICPISNCSSHSRKTGSFFLGCF